MEGTIRTFSKDVYEAVPQLVERVVKETAATFGAEGTFTNNRLLPPTINNNEFAAMVRESVKKVAGEDGNLQTPPTMGGEDMSMFLNEVPGAIALLGCYNEECGAVWPQHSGNYCIDESVLIKGVRLYAQVAMDHNAK